MYEDKIDMVEPELLEGAVEVFLCGLLTDVSHHLRRDEDLITTDARVPYGLPDTSLVAIRLGGIDEAIACSKRVTLTRSASAASTWKSPKPMCGIVTPFPSVMGALKSLASMGFLSSRCLS